MKCNEALPPPGFGSRRDLEIEIGMNRAERRCQRDENYGAGASEKPLYNIVDIIIVSLQFVV